ncbi:ubiquinone biosynthesis monooxygenase COQ6, mitochondrial [Leptinotarsa decemlineata]|uniref:ubiquinone biosynthesis monooxygenase COQ6, mitochondrial n=1 Tax=Leptinotarsa decemlineata TaxID=7539 RepID=UPI003D305C4E
MAQSSIWVSNVFGKFSRNNFLTKHFSSEVTSKNYYDVVIAGGGMVGTTLACTLGKNSKLSSKRILLLEASKGKDWSLPEKYSNRVISINPGTYKLLNDSDIWKHIKNGRYTTVKRLQVWDAVSDTSITFGEQTSADDVSYIVENDLLLGAASEEVKNINNVEVLYNAKVKCYHLPDFHENSVEIILEDGTRYSSELLLGCDGVNSQVRKAMDVNYLSWSYNQMGVVATLKLSEEIENTVAWQRFLPTGPIAFLPLTKTLSSLVWSTTPEHAKNLLKQSESEFVDSINEAIWKVFSRNSVVDQATKTFDNLLRMMNCSADTVRQYPPKIAGIEEGSRAAFPLGFGHATSYIAKGAVLVGDAAHRIHPLAGQGVNLGFGDVVCLNRILGNAVYSGSKLNDLSYLKEYETERQRHNVPTMLAVEGLHRLYNSNFTPVVLLRSLGLQATHVMNPLKKIIVNQAAA